MSITRRLTIGSVLLAGVLSTLTSVALIFYVHAAALKQMDDSLTGKAHALGSLVRVTDRGAFIMDFDHAVIPEYVDRHSGSYYEVRDSVGRTVIRSPSLGQGRIGDQISGAGGWSLPLPNGKRGRAISVSVVPVSADDDVHPAKSASTDAAHPLPAVTVMVAQDRTSLDRMLYKLLLGLIGAVAVSLSTFALLLRSMVKRSLSPLYQLANRTGAVGPDALHIRFETGALPPELLPIATRLNALMERLEIAFRRERRIGSDIAHELRTPIAELRTLADVACKWTPDADRVPGMMQDVLSIARRMDRLVAALLALARSESAGVQIDRQPVAIFRLVQAWFTKLDLDTAPTLRINVPETCVIASDPLLIGQLIQNLLDNAATYREGEDAIDVVAVQDNGGWTLAISNTTNSLSPEDVPHLFAPFWRKDSSRTGERHCGLGLTLVAGYARQLGLTVTPSLQPDGRFEIRIAGLDAWTPGQPSGTPATSESAL